MTIRGDELGHRFVRVVCSECFTRTRVPIAFLVEHQHMRTWRSPLPSSARLRCLHCEQGRRRPRPVYRLHFVDTSTEDEVLRDNLRGNT